MSVCAVHVFVECLCVLNVCGLSMFHTCVKYVCDLHACVFELSMCVWVLSSCMSVCAVHVFVECLCVLNVC